MRAKQQPQARPQAPPSPPPASNLQSATSTYSALVSAIPTGQIDKQDEVHPFRYSKDELLKIYKDSPKGILGLEVERWDGVVREIGSDPVGLREMGEAEKKVRTSCRVTGAFLAHEKKLFAGPLNSDLRRRQSTDYLSPLNVSSLGTERTRLNHNSPSTTGSPLRERYVGLKRRDSNAGGFCQTSSSGPSSSTFLSKTLRPRLSLGRLRCRLFNPRASVHATQLSHRLAFVRDSAEGHLMGYLGQKPGHRGVATPRSTNLVLSVGIPVGG